MIAKCSKDLENVPTLHRIEDKDKQQTFIKWNYSPKVESYYPKGYIEDDMWDLTHFDYDDDNMDKAYKYATINKMSVILPDLSKNSKALQEFIYGVSATTEGN